MTCSCEIATSFTATKLIEPTITKTIAAKNILIRNDIVYLFYGLETV